MNEWTNQWRRKYKNFVIDHYGAKCVCCGETERLFLTIDHMDNNGTKHRKEIGGGGQVLYAWLKKNNFPTNFQVLCMNCNWAKGKFGSCPHQKS